MVLATTDTAPCRPCSRHYYHAAMVELRAHALVWGDGPVGGRLEALSLDVICAPRGAPELGAVDEDVVEDYAAAMLSGAAFPPVAVFSDGADYWLTDGFHRVAAAQCAGLTVIHAQVRPRTRDDAIRARACWSVLKGGHHVGVGTGGPAS